MQNKENNTLSKKKKKTKRTLKWYKNAPQVKESMLIMNENIG